MDILSQPYYRQPAFLNGIRIHLCIWVVLILAGCTAPRTELLSDNAMQGIETIMIMPFQNLYAVYEDRAAIDCTFCNRRHVIDEVPEGTTEFMTGHLKNLLMNDSPYRFVFPGPAGGVLSDLPADENGVIRMTDLVRATGNIDRVDAVVTGYLFRFKERVGTRYSVESPASVSFSLFLVRVSDGQIVWRGIFEETQQSLSENILKIGAFIKRKGRWITARKLAADGLENLLSTFPKP